MFLTISVCWSDSKIDSILNCIGTERLINNLDIIIHLKHPTPSTML